LGPIQSKYELPSEKQRSDGPDHAGSGSAGIWFLQESREPAPGTAKMTPGRKHYMKMLFAFSGDIDA
jgi:hypothetical protein